MHDYVRENVMGGMQQRFFELSKFMNSNANNLFAIEFQPSLRKLWKSASYESIELPRPRNYPWAFRLTHYLIQAIRLGLKSPKSSRADIIYSTSHSLDNVIPAFVVSRLSRRPLVVVFHHLLPEERLSPSSLFASRRLKGNTFATSVLLLFVDLIQRRMITRIDTGFAVSNYTLNDVRNSYGLANVVLTGNGVNPPTRKRFQATFDTAFCGRLRNEKGVDTLVKAWTYVTRVRPGAKLLLIGGSASGSGVVGCQEMVRSLGLQDVVTITGFVPEQKKFELLAQSRLFALPSKIEGFGLAVLEAMSMGLPCILSDIPALRESYDGAAIFLKNNDHYTLGRQILDLLDDAGLQKELSNRSLTLAEQFSWERVANNELNVMNNLVRIYF